MSNLESFPCQRSNTFKQKVTHLSDLIAASETPGTSTGIGVGFRMCGPPSLHSRTDARPTQMAGENQGRCSAFKGRPQGRLTIKLLAGAGRAINQMCPPKKNHRSRGRGPATVPAGRYICCKGIGLLASVPLSILWQGPGLQRSVLVGLAPASLLNVFDRLAQALCHRLVYSCCRYGASSSVRLGRRDAVGRSAWRRPNADGDDCVPPRLTRQRPASR